MLRSYAQQGLKKLLCLSFLGLGCRDAPLPADGDIDGALEQMSSFADASAGTTADEELYSSSVTGRKGIQVSPRGQGKTPSSPQVPFLLVSVIGGDFDGTLDQVPTSQSPDRCQG